MRSTARGALVALAAFAPVALLSPSVAAAAWGSDSGGGITLLGWTMDGSYFAYTKRDVAGEIVVPDGGDDEKYKVELGVVLDGRTGDRVEYLLSLEGKPKPATRKKFEALPNADAFAKWRAGNPVVLLGAPVSPDGKSTAVVEATLAKGRWEAKGFVWKAPEDDAGMPVKLVMSIERDGKRAVSARWEFAGLAGSVELAWAPTGKRLVWLVRQTGTAYGPGIFPGGDLVVANASGPRVEIVADKPLLASAVPAAVAALEKAGFVPIRARPAKKPRPTSVVYATKGHEDEAARAAAAIPGGATVDKLSWATDDELVVELGASAAPR